MMVINCLYRQCESVMNSTELNYTNMNCEYINEMTVMNTASCVYIIKG